MVDRLTSELDFVPTVCQQHRHATGLLLSAQQGAACHLHFLLPLASLSTWACCYNTLIIDH